MEMIDNPNILIYQTNNGNIKVDVKFENETLWLSQAQVCEVFGKVKSTVRNYRTVQIEDIKRLGND